MVYRLDVSFAVGRQSRWRTTTRQSAPLRRIGTFDLAVGAACAFSLSITGQVLTFRTRARLSFAPPPCRMPLGQSQDIPQTDPRGMATPRFWHRLIRFRHVISGSLALASLNHTCRNLVPTFPQRSPPSLLTIAACGGLRSTPDCRSRRAFLHLSYSYAPPCGPALLVTQCQQRTYAVQQTAFSRSPCRLSRLVRMGTCTPSSIGCPSRPAPTFVIMALLTDVLGGGPRICCA